ncbi:hypothetical protein Cob_v012891 [Colletotrichum orbiculare MAFF 240422]|uniref:Uncharacterized protein n=1 Tax=Colletotrichum orbiculare (strain 104-T / ATCC 96160 / CBS 514.97 / LARS 414 / MAFF 240422) TaxID=1213857 RepID=A0A484FAR8_COLOR|nr:hypothetical protein Cob_v012891 [Colletotrichum orbiculare MAFF 240422]
MNVELKFTLSQLSSQLYHAAYFPTFPIRPLDETASSSAELSLLHKQLSSYTSCDAAFIVCLWIVPRVGERQKQGCTSLRWRCAHDAILGPVELHFVDHST